MHHAQARWTYGYLEGITGRGRGRRAAGGNTALPGGAPADGGGRRPRACAAVSLLRPGDMGECGGGAAVRSACAAGRPQGHRQERAGGKSGIGVRPSRVGRVHVCQRGRGGADRRGHAEGRTGGVPRGSHLLLRPAGRLRRAGRGEHGQERGAGRAARHAGSPAGHRCARLPAHRAGRCHTVHRHHELRLRRHPRAERGAGQPLRGGGHARLSPTRICKSCCAAASPR